MESIVYKDGHPYIPYKPVEMPQERMLDEVSAFHEKMKLRRSCRDFSNRPVPENVLREAIAVAALAPSGANKQPWTFCLVGDSDIKRSIRIAAEAEEKAGYEGRMSERWLKDLEPLGTDPNKPFLETAPWLIVVFKRVFEETEGETHNNYDVSESVGIATGFLLTALHLAGLCALTHTPSPMGFLHQILNRPANERAFLLIPVGYAAEDAHVPAISKKSEQEYFVKF
jgi:nitroreductase